MGIFNFFNKNTNKNANKNTNKNININNSINYSSIITKNGVNKVTINGVTRIIKGNNISIKNNKIFVDGKEYIDKENVDLMSSKIINITINGDVESIDTTGDLNIIGNCGNIDCAGSCTIEGDVNGNIDCAGSCDINGKHIGNIDACGNVSIR